MPVHGSGTEKCDQLEEARRQLMIPKSALLRKILEAAGVDTTDPNEWWLVDGRGDDNQFIEPRAGKSSSKVPLGSLLSGMPTGQTAAAIA